MGKMKKALQKAKMERGGDSVSLVSRVASFRSDSKPLKENKKINQHEIEVSYSKTKVTPVDHRILKKNKIFSLFQELETTDQMQILRTQILAKFKEIGGNSLLVTSANPYEGKTFTSINLGVSIAQELNRTVLILDADLRKPTKHHRDFAQNFFDMNITHGLSDYLLGNIDIPDLLINPGINKLTILPSGNPMPNSAELLGSARMESLIAEIKDRYPDDRFVIIDGPATLPCSDPQVLSRYADGILLVVEVEKTTQADLKQAMGLLKGAPIVGTVMNKAKG